MTDMNDDSSPELEPGLGAASAHFDGVADADERALVEGSTELQGLVASFATVKAALNDLPPVPARELDDTLAAALAEFDALAGTSAMPAAATFSAASVARPERARWSRVLAVAAAAAILGVVGVAVAKNVGTSDRSESSSAGEKNFTATTAAAEATAGGAPGLTTTAAGGLSSSSTIGAINGGADALPAYDQPSDLLTIPGTAQDASVTLDSGAPVVPAAAGTPGANGQPLNGPTVFPFTCPLTANQIFLAEISWKGTPAAAVRDTVTNVTQAIDRQCKVLASAP